jgi:hypothetical protein
VVRRNRKRESDDSPGSFEYYSGDYLSRNGGGDLPRRDMWAAGVDRTEQRGITISRSGE